MRAFICDRCGKSYTARSVQREAIKDYNRTIKLLNTNEEIEGVSGITLDRYDGQAICAGRSIDLCPECVSLLNKFFMNKDKEVNYDSL